MPFTRLYISLSVLWIISHDGHGVRIKINHENMIFPSLKFPNAQNNTVLKLVKKPNDTNIYAGSPQGFYFINGESEELKQLEVLLFQTECQGLNNTHGCGYTVSLLEEGADGALIMCGRRGHNSGTPHKCCSVTSENTAVGCFTVRYELRMNEPALFIGDTLFYTLSGEGDGITLPGLYKQTKNSFTRPLQSDIEQRYVKLLADKSSGSVEGKLYSFFVEKNSNNDPDTPMWLPKVSQVCMADDGGDKNQLQFQWTSMLTARLFCGDEKKRTSFTELLDVAVLEAENRSSSMIYALFRNDYNLSAICVYKMSDISHTFTNSMFVEGNPAPKSPRPGECIKNKAQEFLRFMATRPVMKDWVKPARSPVLISHYHHYTHLQVDRVEGKAKVLVLALESGRVHKVLEQDGEAFIIAEYQPFASTTRVQSMFLDSSTKQLYLSSNSEVVRVNLMNCSLYGAQCCLCVLARDPYCGWDQNSSSCSPVFSHQDLSGNCTVCKEVLNKASVKKPNETQLVITTQGSTLLLKCPSVSWFASSTWFQGERRRDCDLVSSDQGCVLLIDSMSKKDHGTYRCIANENGQEITLGSQEVPVNSAKCPRVTFLLPACLLLLLSVIC